VAQILGVPEDRIDLRYNDVAAPKLVGVGTFGSRSLISHGAALATGAKDMVEKGRKLAASSRSKPATSPSPTASTGSSAPTCPSACGR
jgi:CO/xanthine dehydrogenase Mo-binding subunit